MTYIPPVREVITVKKLSLVLFCLMLLGAPLAHAADLYPSKVITIIVPFSAGGKPKKVLVPSRGPWGVLRH